MAEEIVKEGTIAFQAEGRLLQELGLRLVASPEVALMELIKNAYDADSPYCSVQAANELKLLTVSDGGHGMTFEDFATKWMRIATSSKTAGDFSPQYKRRLTGAKGIGRFAVRYLGDHLVLVSVAFDKKRKSKTQLTATFDWPQIDKIDELSDVKVKYKVIFAPKKMPTGTTLFISKLRKEASFVTSRALRDNILKMASPIEGLERGRFQRSSGAGDIDPGFRINLPLEVDADDVNLASQVLSNFWARLVINLNGDRLKFEVTFSSSAKPKVLSVTAPNDISNGFFADIRYFPRRKGLFSGTEVNGVKAIQWVRENSGVAIVDHGFRMKPYGFADNDWLFLDADGARNLRDWRTAIAQEHFPIPEAIKPDPGLNPALYLPHSQQLIGAVFIESNRRTSDNNNLIPAMDREGLLQNAGADKLADLVRAGIEFLANEDKTEQNRLLILEAKAQARAAQDEVKTAIEHIESSPTLVASDKARIVKQYTRFAEHLEEQADYTSRATRSLTAMSLLGVVAGFMTHESKAIVHDLQHAVGVVEDLAKKHSSLKEVAFELRKRLQTFRGQLEYARLFIGNVRASKEESFSAAGQVRHVLNRFEAFAIEHGIDVKNEIPTHVMTPAVPVSAYSGILLNLYTNALKAILAAQSSVKKPKIHFRGWNEKKTHFLEVLDNGIGIPHELRRRIWDPLYTTTSDIGNPLGSGMGLGLPLVRQVVMDLGGSVHLVSEVPPGFVTAFRVELPLQKKG